MKNATIVLAVLGLVVTSCSASNLTPTGQSSGGAMQPLAELAAGTMKLEGTAEAITKEQATRLLPLWEVYKEIGGSDTAARQEVEGLTAQIQEAMTEAQLKSIKAMKLTQEDVMRLMRQQGPAMSTGGGSGGSAGRSSGNSFFVGGGPAGGFPGGDMPPEGAMGPGGGFAGGTQGTGTPQANSRQARTGGKAGVPIPLVNAVVEYLKTKAGG